MQYKRKKFLKIFLTLLIIIVVAFIIFFSFYKVDYIDFIENEIKHYPENKILSTELVLSIIKAESNFNPNAKSSAGAIGLMQILPKTGNWILEELRNENRILTKNFYDPYVNIVVGIWYLNYLSKKFENLDYIIASYNAGETEVLKWKEKNLKISQFPYKETKNYVKKVQNNVIIYVHKINILNICWG